MEFDDAEMKWWRRGAVNIAQTSVGGFLFRRSSGAQSRTSAVFKHDPKPWQ